ncbi:MAG: DUF393 domain-containing protein [Gammaproteobacteria bacterium HGW-Gammaproteobacteria-11]|nr:MAG: DUF393 domain-containing protein [Gammaproteobacteria bacterium HGW-Gammaproteobacteria-11]
MPIPDPAWPLTLFYDGDCPLCLREIHMFENRNHQQNLLLEDIAAKDTTPLPGLSREQMLDCLHARFADGRVVTGIDATYWSYHAVGLGWVIKPLGWRWARPFWQMAYRLFCRLRPGIARLVPMPGARCRDGQCDIAATNKKVIATEQQTKVD